MSRDAQQLLKVATSQADALARVRAAKRSRRLQEHRRRLEQTSEPDDRAFLTAVALDDRRDARELVLEAGSRDELVEPQKTRARGRSGQRDQG